MKNSKFKAAVRKGSNGKQNKRKFVNKVPGRNFDMKDEGIFNPQKDFNPRKNETEYGTSRPGRNDLILKDAQLLKDLGSPSFANPIGRYLYNGYSLPEGCDVTQIASAAPGILTSEFYYGPGYAENKTDPLNMAANKIWNELRKGITGSSRSYGAADLMMSIQAVDSCYVMVNYIKRFFGIYRRFKQSNAYTPKAFFDSAYVSYDDFAENAPAWRSRFNLLIKRLDIFKIPAAMQLLIRHSSMVSSIWMDGNDDRCQYYWMIPAGYYTWEDELDPNGSRLKWNWLQSHHDFDDTPETVSISDLLDILERMINKLYYSTALISMTGDIEKAFPGATTYITMMDDDYQIDFEFHDSWLFELQNADVLSPYKMYEAVTNHFDVYQDEDGILHSAPGFSCTPRAGYYPQFESNSKVMGMPALLNIGNNSPSPEIVVENCQWKVSAMRYLVDAGNDANYFIANYQSEVLTGMWITQHTYTFNTLGRLTLETKIYPNYTTFWDEGDVDAGQLFQQIGLYNEFTYHPALRHYTTTNSSGDVAFYGYLSDTRNIAFVATDLIAKQHEAVLFALYSLL